MPLTSPYAARLAGLTRPPVVGGPVTPSGPQLAQPVANPGARGQNMRYFLGNLTQLPDGTYTDGVYRYDSNGLSLDRPDSPVSGLPPADWGDRWDVWRAPSLTASSPLGPPGPSGGPSSAGALSGGFRFPGQAQSMAALQPFVSQIGAMIPRPGSSPGLLERLPPEDVAGMPSGKAISYQGAPSLAELLQVAMARGPRRPRGML